MTGLTRLLLILLILISCTQHELTFTELQKASWDSLAPGVDHISNKKEKGIALKADSIELTLKGIAGEEASPIEMAFINIPHDVKAPVISFLNLYLSDSKAGYLKINFDEMARPLLLRGRVYLRSNYYDTLIFISDSITLMGIPGITRIRFISKEEAKKEYIAAGNDDWDKVLDTNPLPNSIEISLENKDWTEELLNELKKEILDKIILVSDIHFPAALSKKTKEYFFFFYKRRIKEK